MAAAPWRLSGDLWSILLGMVLFEKVPRRVISQMWPVCADRWPSPSSYLADKQRHTVLSALRKGTMDSHILTIAKSLLDTDTRELSSVAIPEVSSERLKIALTLASHGDRVVVTSPSARVAERVFGEELNGSGRATQLSLARLVGIENPSRSYAAVLEVGDRFCLTHDPRCSDCPLQNLCQTGSKNTEQRSIR